MGDQGASEFDLIEKYLRPLTRAHKQARALCDDAALVDDYVISNDVLVEGVHFLPVPQSPLHQVAQKAIRVNVSDIIAKGATPYGYFLGIVWPGGTTENEFQKFAQGLKEDGDLYGLSLLGGDTTRHKGAGPLTISITMLGLSAGRVPARNGAQVGDSIYVTGTIGDSTLGLAAYHNDDPALAPLKEHYLRPQPPMGIQSIIAEFATASIDISDGLLADATHIALQSNVQITLDLHTVPHSSTATRWLVQADDEIKQRLALLTGGDDYQTLFTVPGQSGEDMEKRAADAGLQVTRIGSCGTGPGGTVELVSPGGASVPYDDPGYRHF